MARKEALDALDLRLAKGEITPEQYDDLKRRILARDGAEPGLEEAPPAPGDDPVVVQVLETVNERRSALSDTAYLVALILGLVIVAAVLIANHFLAFLPGLEQVVERLVPSRWKFLSAYLVPLAIPIGSAAAVGLIVSVWVWLRSLGDSFAKPLPAETFATLTAAQRTAISERLEGVTLKENRFEYEPEFGPYALVSGFGGLALILLYWSYRYFAG
jgi:hypothetical protein